MRKAVVRLGRRPILFIHGEKDSYIPVIQSQALYELARGPKYLWVVPGAKHNQAIECLPREYGRRVARFFEEHLASDDPVPQRSMESHRFEASSSRLASQIGEPVGARSTAEQAPAEQARV